MKHTATLKNAKWLENSRGYVFGNVYNDSQKRWADGTEIWTSSVVKVDGDKVTTRSGTVYTCEWIVK